MAAMSDRSGLDGWHTGMRGAYGKPNGLSARVKINQIMFSIRTTLKGEEHACEALRKVMFRQAPPAFPCLLTTLPCARAHSSCWTQQTLEARLGLGV